MSARRPALLALSALLLTPALASAADRAPRERRAPSLERERQAVLDQVGLAESVIGRDAAETLAERALAARSADELELVVDDGIGLLDAYVDGLLDPDQAEDFLLRSPSAILLRQERLPQLFGRGQGQATWTRGSWMDSPDGAG